MGRWLEHSVTTEIQAPVEQVWAVWSDLEAMPRWMRWIESVVTEPDDPVSYTHLTLPTNREV